MARGKVQLKRIENPIHRQVTFCKRRAGLLKKARELSVLCDADVGLMIFSTRGKLYELAAKGTMQGLIERYTKHSRGTQVEERGASNHVEVEQEISILKREVHLLQNAMRYMFGGGSRTMKLDELHALENYLETWICKIRLVKNQVLFQEIQHLKHQEDMLKAANALLQGKIEEQHDILGVVPMIAGIPRPLTIQNEIFQI